MRALSNIEMGQVSGAGFEVELIHELGSLFIASNCTLMEGPAAQCQFTFGLAPNMDDRTLATVAGLTALFVSLYPEETRALYKKVGEYLGMN